MIPLVLAFVEEAPKDSGSNSSFWVWVLGMFAIFYFMMIRPQMKEQKKRREMLGELKKNDKVVTSSGMIGTIVSIDDHEVTLKVDDSNNVRVRFLRSAIAGLAAAPAPAAAQVAEKS